MPTKENLNQPKVGAKFVKGQRVKWKHVASALNDSRGTTETEKGDRVD